MFIDPLTTQVFKMRPRGTWMTQVGLVSHDFALDISVVPREETEECQVKPKDCLTYGSVMINQAESVYLVGGIQLAGNIHVQLSNKKSFSTVSASLDRLDIQVDIVPPPKVVGLEIPVTLSSFFWSQRGLSSGHGPLLLARKALYTPPSSFAFAGVGHGRDRILSSQHTFEPHSSVRCSHWSHGRLSTPQVRLGRTAHSESP